jgi:hypothetical protein
MDDFAASFGSFLGQQAPPPAPPPDASDGEIASPRPPRAPNLTPKPTPDAFGKSFGDFLQDADQQRDVAARLNLMAANKGNPDQAAKDITLGEQTGLPPDTVERNRPTIEQQAKIEQQAQILKGNPALTWWLQDSNAAKIAHDDFEKLDTVHKLFSAWQSGFAGAQLQNKQGRIGFDIQSGIASDGQKQELAAIESKLSQPFGGEDSFWSKVKLAAGLAGGILDTANQAGALASEGAAVGAGIGALATGAPTGGLAAPVGAVAGAAVGGGAGFLSGMFQDQFKIAAGNTYLGLKKLKDENGTPIDESVAQGASLFSGLVGGAINTFGVKVGAAPFVKATTESLVREAIQQAVTKPTFARAVGQFGINMAKSGAEGALLGFASEFAQLAAEQGAKLASSGNFETILDSERERQAAVGRLVTSALDMAQGMALLHVAPAGFSLGRDAYRARVAGQDQVALQSIIDGSADTKTLGRSRDLFQRYLALQSDGSPVENLYVPGEKVRELYQTFGVDPEGEHDPLFGWVPNMREQYAQSLITKGDVVIPTADYVSRVAGTKLHEALKDDIRARQDGVSVNDAKAFENAYQQHLEAATAEMKAQADQATAAAAPGQRVFDDIHGQLRAAGIAPDAARQYAALYAARYTTRGLRLGADPYSLYQRSGVEVHQVLPESLRSHKVDQLDTIINALRSQQAGTGNKPPSQRSLYGPSLAEFVARRGGITDEGGELRAMGADRWHIGKPGMPRLVRAVQATGETLPGVESRDALHELSPDAVARAAWEERYFPEHSERPTPDALFTALEDEMHGRPRFAERNTIDPSEHLADTLADLEQTLRHLGIDLKTASNAEVKAALAKMHEIEPSTYEQSDFATKAREIADQIGFSETDLREAQDVIEKVQRGQEDPGVSDEQRATIKQLLGDVTGRQGDLAAKGDDGRSADTTADRRAGAATELEQGRASAGGARGSIRFENGRALIQLFDRANLSTLLHESGHLWYEELAADAARPDAPAQLKADFAAIRGWLGAAADGPLTGEQHETFARAFETYLMEGKAPSEGLRSAFESFKAWLVHIYRTLASLNAPINNEVRAVFDRLIASDEEIARARGIERAQQLFPDAEKAGMTDAEFKAYTRTVAEARGDADTELLTKVMSEVRRRRTAEWRTEASSVRAEVRQQIDARPDMQALEFLRKGRLTDGREFEPGMPSKLSRDALVEMYGNEEVLRMLPRSVPPIYSERGAHPDFVAELFGFRDGRDLVDKLMSMEQQRRDLRATGEKRGLRQYLIDTETEARMRERHGDSLADGSIQREALDAIHNDKQAAVLATELRALARRAQTVEHEGRRWNVGVVTPLEVARSWAARVIAGKSVKEGTAVSEYARAEAKAGRAVEAALLAGDYAEAFRQKQAQLMAHVLYSEAKRARDDVDKSVSMMAKLAAKRTVGGMAHDYLEQIHGLLERFDFRPVSGKQIEHRKALAAFVEEQRAAGNDVADIPEKLLSDAFRQHYTEMTIDDMRGLADSVRNLAHLGRLKERLILLGEERDFEATVDELVEKAAQLPQHTPETLRDPSKARSGMKDIARAYLWNAKHGLKSMDAALLKLETILTFLDNKDPNGAWHRLLFRPLSEAETKEKDMQVEATKALNALRERIPKEAFKDINRKVSTPELVGRDAQLADLSLGEVISMALNWGNEGNRDALLKGDGWSEAAVQAVLNRTLTKDHWDFVQGTWDILEKYWPQIAEMERRLSGVAPPKIEREAIDTPHGRYEGGYYPIKQDPRLSAEAGKRSEAASDLFENSYQRAATPKGHTIERTGQSNKPLYLSLSLVPNHIMSVIHDLAWRETLMNVDKLAQNKEVRSAVIGALGPEYHKQFRPLLQSIANDRIYDPNAMDFYNNLAHSARMRATMVGLGFRISTMLKHGSTASMHSLAEIGPKWMGSAAKDFMGSPAQTTAFIFERSGEMRHRMNEIDRDTRDYLREMEGKGGPVNWVRRHAYTGIGALDMASALPVWLGGYKKALSDGMTEEDAISFGDRTVRNAHGGTGTKDLAMVQRQNEVMKLTTMFYTFFSHVYQAQRQVLHDTKNVESLDDFLSLAGRGLIYFAWTPLVEAYVLGHGPNEDDNWLTWATKHVAAGAMAGIPWVREFAPWLTEGIGHASRETPIGQIGHALYSAGSDVANAIHGEKEVSARWLRHAADAAGYILHLPLGQPGLTTQYIWDVWNGEADPETLAEFARGAAFGPPRKE